MDDLKEIVRRYPQRADQALLNRVRDPAETRLVISSFEDVDLGDGHGVVSSFLLHLCDSAIHEQLDSRDVAAVVGGEERHGLCDLVRSTEATEWHSGGDHLRALLPCLGGGEQLVESRRIDGTGAHRIHPNAAILQFGRPRPGERADGSLRGAVHAVGWKSLAADDRRVEDDRRAVGHQRKRLLHGEQQALYVDVEDRVVELVADLAEGRVPRDARIREQDVEPPLFTLDLAEEAVEVGMVRNAAPDTGDVVPDLLDGRRQLRLTASSDEHVRAPSPTNCSAAASPIPLLPPVTSAILPSSFPMSCSLRCARITFSLGRRRRCGAGRASGSPKPPPGRRRSSSGITGLLASSDGRHSASDSISMYQHPLYAFTCISTATHPDRW